MTNERSYKKRIILLLLLLLLLSVTSDVLQENDIKNGTIERAEIGGQKEEMKLQLEVEGQKKEYILEVMPAQPTKEEAEQYFEQAIEEIEEDFQDYEEKLPQRETYVTGIVNASWRIAPHGYVDANGYIRYEKIADGGELMQAEVTLTCGKYERRYQFSFWLLPQILSEDEKTTKLLEEYFSAQMEMEGSTYIELPKQIGDNTINWLLPKEYITPKILLLEVVAIILVLQVAKEKKKKEEKKRLTQMERVYPDLVNQLSFLIGAGMTTRQAWSRISAQYVYKKREKLQAENMVYEAVLRMNRRFLEGDSEAAIYQQFMQEIPVGKYRRLMRMLLGSTEKGALGISERLEEESRQAYEQRVMQAKKLGEEASAKMLLPLMLMLMVVMGIVILPALIGLQI